MVHLTINTISPFSEGVIRDRKLPDRDAIWVASVASELSIPFSIKKAADGVVEDTFEFSWKSEFVEQSTTGSVEVMLLIFTGIRIGRDGEPEKIKPWPGRRVEPDLDVPKS